MKVLKFGKLAAAAAFMLLAAPAFADLATEGGSAAADMSMGAPTGASDLSTTVTTALDGPAVSDAPILSKTYADDDYSSNGKTLTSFGSRDWWDDWDWNDWWDDWDNHDHDDCDHVVPEPSSMALLGIGVGLLAARRRFKKQ